MGCRNEDRREQPNGSARSGFTLIEMLVCLAILAMLMAVFVPVGSGSRARAQLASSAHELAIALRETRDLALTTSRTETFAIDLSKRVYRAGEHVAARGLDRDIAVTLVTADGDKPSATNGGIRFFGDGSSTGGIVRLSLDKRRLDILVDWLTGRVSVADPADGAQR
jgi:general secretion pathway protein H